MRCLLLPARAYLKLRMIGWRGPGVVSVLEEADPGVRMWYQCNICKTILHVFLLALTTNVFVGGYTSNIKWGDLDVTEIPEKISSLTDSRSAAIFEQITRSAAKMENRRNIISFFILVWRILLVAGSQRCNMDLCTAPDLTNSSELYELQLSSQQYSTTENGKMQLSGKLEWLQII